MFLNVYQQLSNVDCRHFHQVSDHIIMMTSQEEKIPGVLAVGMPIISGLKKLFCTH